MPCNLIASQQAKGTFLHAVSFEKAFLIRKRKIRRFFMKNKSFIAGILALIAAETTMFAAGCNGGAGSSENSSASADVSEASNGTDGDRFGKRRRRRRRNHGKHRFYLARFRSSDGRGTESRFYGKQLWKSYRHRDGRIRRKKPQSKVSAQW